MKRRIIIPGGGLAGIAAAVRVADAGEAPVLLESTKRLGGRATSLRDPRTGRVIDNCQHVVMGCCTNILDLYERLGVLGEIEWHESFTWTAGGGVFDRMGASRLPAPFHLGLALRRLSFLDGPDRRAIARAMWGMIRMGFHGRLRWRGRTFEDFLVDQRQPASAVSRFWNTVIVSACNLPVQRVDAEAALQVFQEGFLANRWSYAMGLALVPLERLYDPAVAVIENAGGSVHVGVSARAIAFDGRRATGVVTSEDMHPGAAVIAAVPPERLLKLTSDTMRRADTRLQRLSSFEYSPILGVHLVFDQSVMDMPHLTLVDHGVQWVFNKGTDADGRQHLHAVISAADEWMDLEEAVIVDRVVGDLHACLPRSVGLRPIEARAIKEKRATIAASPGSLTLRPSVEPGTVGLGGGIANLFIAGDWCDTGWPPTMEGAVRSGYRAAEAAVGGPGPVADIPPGLVARALGMR
ncbi:MAG: hydroxysqualene dehydroxylase HpnE [Planctomycetota bacterium]